MEAVVFHGISDIGLDEVKEPELKEQTDAIVAITTCAICGTDVHVIRGTLPGMQKGTILGHEGVGIVEDVGKEVRKFSAGERAITPSTIGCAIVHIVERDTMRSVTARIPMGCTREQPFRRSQKLRTVRRFAGRKSSRAFCHCGTRQIAERGR